MSCFPSQLYVYPIQTSLNKNIYPHKGVFKKLPVMAQFISVQTNLFKYAHVLYPTSYFYLICFKDSNDVTNSKKQIKKLNTLLGV